MNQLLVLALAAAVALLAWLLARVLSRWFQLPCPSWLPWIVDNPIAWNRARAVPARLQLAPGMRVLDAGCGTGRLAVPIARAVGPQGRVLAVDLQPGMIQRAKAKAEAAGVTNIDFLQAGLGEGKVPAGRFDRALLSWVLGEIPDRPAALREIHVALTPGGFLLVSEVLIDPHYQPLKKVRAMAEACGFHAGARHGTFIEYSLVLEKPGKEKWTREKGGPEKWGVPDRRS